MFNTPNWVYFCIISGALTAGGQVLAPMLPTWTSSVVAVLHVSIIADPVDWHTLHRLQDSQFRPAENKSITPVVFTDGDFFYYYYYSYFMYIQ